MKKSFYILIYSENTDYGDPTCSMSVRLFAKKITAQEAMKKSFQETDAIMHYSEMVTDDEHFICQTEDEIFVQNGMDTCRWSIREKVVEDD